MPRLGRHHRIAAVALTLAGGAALARPVPAAAAAPTAGHAAVIAQGVMEFTGQPVQWATASETLPATGPPLDAAADTPVFLVVTRGAAVTADAETSPLARLGIGEAAYVAAALGTTVAAVDGADAALERISIVTDGGIGDPFSPGAGFFDVDLLRGVLEPGEALPLAGGAPTALIMVTEGTVLLAGGSAGTTEETAGAARAVAGAVTLVNAGTSRAVVLVAVIGPPIGGTAVVPGPGSAPTAPAIPGSSSTPGASPTSAPQPPTAAASDRDGDGLTDDDEAALGTNPDDPDSDGDRLSDGDEVNTFGTNPLSSRTDGDHLNDGDEVDMGLDPLDRDTDGDGISDDADENPLTPDGTPDPDADTDGDGLSDGEEANLGTDPNSEDTDGDGIGDASEAQAGTDPLDAGDPGAEEPEDPETPDDEAGADDADDADGADDADDAEPEAVSGDGF